MKKKITAFIVVMVLVVCAMCGCSVNQEKANVKEPDIIQIRNICNLATLECYYHNVAKSTKEPEAGITHVGEKERTFWIEYTGKVRLGIDMSKVTMKINGSDVEVTIPEAKVLSSSIDKKTLDENSYISSEDGWNKNSITATDQTKAIDEAQKGMEEEVKKNSSLLLSAQNRSKTLIENYINQLGEASGIQYNIKWNYIDSDTSAETTVTEETDSEE